MARAHSQAESSRTAALRALSHFATEQLEDEIGRRMAQFSSRQLERELSRRKKRDRTRRADVSNSGTNGLGFKAASPIDLTAEDDVELNVVMKIDNEDDLQTDVKSEGEHDSVVNAASRSNMNGYFKVKVESESEDELYAPGSPRGRNGFRVKVENESEAESEVEPNVVMDDGNDFRATVKDESESERELHDENDSGDDFWAPVNNDERSGMDDNMQTGVQASMENEDRSIVDDVVDEYMDQSVNYDMDDNLEDEKTDGGGGGAENHMDNEIVNDLGNDGENFLEDGAKDSIVEDMDEDVDIDMEGASDGERRPSQAEKAHGRGRGRVHHSRRQPKAPVYEVKVDSLAELGKIRVNPSTADIDYSMMEKIKMCLTRGQHPSTPEGEAKRALLHAKILMKRYNVSRAEVLANEPLSAQKKYGGESVVSLRRVDGDKSKPVQQQCFLDYLLWAMQIFFDCAVYHTAYQRERPDGRTYTSSVEYTFYGIAENTIAAAMGFEMAYNLISQWARSQEGKNCYCLGAAMQLEKMAIIEKAEEEAQAKKAESDSLTARMAQEAAEEKARLARLVPVPDTVDQPSSPDPLDEDKVSVITLDSEESWSSDDGKTESDEDHDDGDNIEADFIINEHEMEDVAGALSEEISMMNQAEYLITSATSGLEGASQATAIEDTYPRPTKGGAESGAGDTEQHSNEPEAAPDRNWASQMQLTIFRANAAKIADEYLKDKGVKLGKGRRSRKDDIKDFNAYERGMRDGKKIDVHQKRIKEAHLADDMSGRDT